MKSNITLMPEQSTFMQSKKPFVAYVGGIGAGKSYVACIKAVRNALQGRSQLMVGLTFSHARDVLFDTLKKVLDAHGLEEGIHWTANKSQLEIEVLKKGKIYIKSAELGDKLRGYNVSDVFIDEAAYHKNNEVFNILLGRIREVDDAQIHLTTSPRGFNWVYDLTEDDDCEYIKVSTFKNPFLPTRYIKNMLKQYSSTFIKQELYADFVNISTGIFNAEWINTLEENAQLHTKYVQDSNIKRIRFWDFAFGDDKSADYSAGILVAKVNDNYVIEDIIRVKKTYTSLKEVIIETALKDGNNVEIGFEKAGQQKAVIDDLVRDPRLSGYVRTPFNVAKHGAKMKRILPLASSAENGQIFIKNNCKHKADFMRECNELTLDDSHLNDDMVDACASAYLMFNNSNKVFGYRADNFYA